MIDRSRATAVGVAVLMLVLVQQFVQIGNSSILLRTFQNVMHIPMFAGVAVLLGYLLRWQRPWLVFLVCLALGAVTEIIQLFNARSASFEDLAMDMLGAGLVVMGIYLSRAFGRGDPRRRVAVWGVTGLAVVAATAFAPARVVYAYALRDLAFPVVFSPGMSGRAVLWEVDSRARWVEPPDAPWHGDPDVVLELTWQGGSRFPDVTIHEPAEDWSGYESLVVEVLVPDGDPMPLTAAVGYGRKQYRSAVVYREAQPGFQRLRYPVRDLIVDDEGRHIVRRLVLHTELEAVGRRMYLGSVTLE